MPTPIPYSHVQLMHYHQKKAMHYCKKYHTEINPKRKDLYFKLSIRHSVKHERLEKDEKSF
jgi:hypothetical protein